MQINTAAVENQPNCSVEKETFRFDPFTITNGRYVGSDGFIVPRDFDEFYERFPGYVRKWVSKHADRSAPKEDIEDWTHDLLIHLYELPQTSKYRKTGKEDVVQTFDAVKHYGCNEARFRNYISLCLANKLRTLNSKRMKDALCRPGNVSIDGQTGDGGVRSVDDEYCQKHSAHLQQAAKASEKQAQDRAFVQEFVNFARREDPKILSAMEAVLATGTQADAADFLGISESEFGRKHIRLCQLARCFVNGEVVPKQRKPYKKRIPKSQQFSGSHPNCIQSD